MQVTHRNSVSYRDGSITLTIETTSVRSKYDARVGVSKDTYYLEINDETKRLNADEFASLKSIMRTIMGIEE